jgi:hypothetical protein
MIGTRGPYFRATCGAISAGAGAAEGGAVPITIERAVAAVLNIGVGDSVRVATLRPRGGGETPVAPLEYQEREGSD